MVPVAPGAPIAWSRPCTGIKGITYLPKPGVATQGEGNVIMLCAIPFTYPTGFTPRWNSKGRLAIFTQQANQQVNEGQTPAGLDLFSMLTSKTIIHELMHAIDFGTCKYYLLAFNAKANFNVSSRDAFAGRPGGLWRQQYPRPYYCPISHKCRFYSAVLSR
jgi:hypothetical protein